MNEQDYNNAESVAFICMDNMDLQTAITETFSMIRNISDSQVKTALVNHLNHLLEVQHERASLRAVTERKK